jgi:predicted dehydrogenase
LRIAQAVLARSTYIDQGTGCQGYLERMAIMRRRQCSQVNRRKFLQIATGAALAPMIVPRHVVARSQTTAPSDRITLGFIGTGSMGGGHVRGFLKMPDVRIPAISDIRMENLQRSQGAVNQQYGDSSCAAIPDFRELLARPDIDAVCIATGERWHPLVGIEAARRGKHMYCEKPLSVTLAEGLAMRAAIQKYGVVFQWGTQQRSSVNYRLTAELARNGYLGDIRTIMIGSAGGSAPKPEPPETLKDPPPGFDYDRWLGPSPYVPYSDVRVSRTWMFIRDYGIGCLGGAWGIHDLDAAQFFLDTDDTTPIEIEGRARYYQDVRDVPYSWTVEQKYANGASVIHMDLVTAKKRAKQFELGSMASLVTGSKGWVWVSRQGVRTEPESLATTVIGPQEKHVIFSDDHKQNFLDAIRKKAQPISPITAAVHAETMCQQSDIAMQLERKLRWDPKAERFIDDEQANRMLSRAIRAPWTYTI